MIRDAVKADYEMLAALAESVANIHYAARPDVFKPPAIGEDNCFHGKENYFDMLQRDEVMIFVYEESTPDDSKGEILGFCHLDFYDYGEDHPVYKDVVVCNLTSMAVVEKAQRRGIGKALLQHAKERAIECGAERLVLSVWPFNESARALYESAGLSVLYTQMEWKLGD